MGYQDIINNKLRIWSYEEFIGHEFPPPQPIVEGIINFGELCIMSGPAKIGKSVLSTQMALCVSEGLPFLKKYPVQRSNVLLIQTEIANSSFQKRINKMNIIQNEKNQYFHVSNSHIRLDLEEQVYDLEKKIKEYEIDLLLLDPFYTLHRKNENNSTEMAPILFNLKKLVNAHNIGCLLVHHQGKKNENTKNTQPGHRHRGSSSFAHFSEEYLQGSVRFMEMGLTPDLTHRKVSV